VPGLPQRPSGRRFGRLLHAVLQSGGGAQLHGRCLDATAEEIDAAVRLAEQVFAHPCVGGEGCEVYRELPILLRLDDGTLVEGRIDFASTDGNSWTVVDYKSGVEKREKGKRQLQLYALAIRKSTGQDVRAVLLEI
jgi:ATP-dependent exoDNAse (exonuclease V) beta subunit